jgi:hypothetical protein
MVHNSKEIKVISSAHGNKKNPFKKDKLKKFTSNPYAGINKLMLPNPNYHTAKGKRFLPRKQEGGWLDQYDDGGNINNNEDIITDPRGQWAHPGEITKIPSGNITMEGVPYPILGVDNLGNQQLMYPGLDYTFPGQSVTEYPIMQDGGVPWQDKGSILTAQQQNEQAYNESVKQAQKEIRQDYINNYVKEGHKKIIDFAPFKAAAYSTPVGMAVGAIQGAVNLAPDLYNKDYLEAAGDAAMMLPFINYKNLYNVNPLSEKLNNPNTYKRIVGEPGYEAYRNTGKVTASPTGTESLKYGRFEIGKRSTPFPSFSKGTPDSNYLPTEGKGYIFESNNPMVKRGDTNPVTGKKVKGKHWAYRPIDPKTGRVLTELEDVKVYEGEPHWWKGYKQLKSEITDKELLNKFSKTQFDNTRTGTVSKNMEPYISKKIIKETPQEEVYNSFLSPEMQQKKIAERTINYDKNGNIIKKLGGQSNWLDNYK